MILQGVSLETAMKWNQSPVHFRSTYLRPAEKINVSQLLLTRRPLKLRLRTITSVMERGASLQVQHSILLQWWTSLSWNIPETCRCHNYYRKIGFGRDKEKHCLSKAFSWRGILYSFEKESYKWQREGLLQHLFKYDTDPQLVHITVWQRISSALLLLTRNCPGTT